MTKYSNEIECPDCKGHGVQLVVGKLDDVDRCPCCDGTGWREPTDEERDDAAANAFSDMCEGEPPLSFAERTAMQAKREEQWGVR